MDTSFAAQYFDGDHFRLASEFKRRIAPIVSYELPSPQKDSFLAFHRFVSEEPTANIVNQWRSVNAKWHELVVDGILGSVQSSLTIARYHCERIAALESAVIAALQGFPIEKNSAIGGGNTLVFDAEYQAFILSCRRCLDHLSFALSAFFKNVCRSFRGLEKHLTTNHLIGESDIILGALRANRNAFFGTLVSRKDGETSVRDSIAHTKSISAGTLNINRLGAFFTGGGPGDKTSFGDQSVTEVTSQLMQATQRCVDQMIRALLETLERRIQKQGKL